MECILDVPELTGLSKPYITPMLGLDKAPRLAKGCGAAIFSPSQNPAPVEPAYPRPCGKTLLDVVHSIPLNLLLMLTLFINLIP